MSNTIALDFILNADKANLSLGELESGYDALKEQILNSIKKKTYVKELILEDGNLEVVFKNADKTNDLLKFLVSHGVVINKIKKGDSLEDIFIGLVGEEWGM